MITLDSTQHDYDYRHDHQAKKSTSYQWGHCFKSLTSCEACCKYIGGGFFLFHAAAFIWLISICYPEFDNPEINDSKKRVFKFYAGASCVGALLCIGKGTEIIVKRCYSAIQDGRTKKDV